MSISSRIADNPSARGVTIISMTPEAILNHPPSTLSYEQRLHYFDRGYLKLDAYVQGEELEGEEPVCKRRSESWYLEAGR